LVECLLFSSNWQWTTAGVAASVLGFLNLNFPLFVLNLGFLYKIRFFDFPLFILNLRLEYW